MNQRVTPNRGPALLDSVAGRLTTAVGGAFPGERAVFRGHDLHADLADKSWIDLHLFGITGRHFAPKDLRLLEAVWTHTSYPDARIWNNRVAALAGSARSTGPLGVAAALAVSEAKAYGLGACLRVFDFFQQLQQQITAGIPLPQALEQALSGRRSLAGYDRPLARGDERIEPMLKLAEETGHADGVYLNLALAVDRLLIEQGKPWRMNYAALAAALPMDLGLNRRQYELFMMSVFFAGMPPCYIEAADKPEGTLFPTACSAIQYQGPPPRDWGK
jgi:hypothetical protein